MTAPPDVTILRPNSRFSSGKNLSMAPPKTPIVTPPAASAPLCAYASIPVASPDITLMPLRTMPAENVSAISVPYKVGRRVPTTAIPGRDRTSGFPATYSTSGLEGKSSSDLGYRLSQQSIKVIFFFRASAISDSQSIDRPSLLSFSGNAFHAATALPCRFTSAASLTAPTFGSILNATYASCSVMNKTGGGGGI